MNENFYNPSTPQEREKTPEEIIQGFKDDFEKYLSENPELAQKLKQEILSMAGVGESEMVNPQMNYDFGIIKVPVAELIRFGTACGEIDNKAFSKKVVDFLIGESVEFIIALSSNKNFTIGSAAIQMNQKGGRKLEAMIEKNDGSLRCDSSPIRGWTVYESE